MPKPQRKPPVPVETKAVAKVAEADPTSLVTLGMMLQRIDLMGPFIVEWFAKRVNPDAPSVVLAHHYVAMRAVADAMAKSAEAVADMYDNMKQNVVPAAFERDGVTSQTLAGLGRVTVSDTMYASIRADKSAEAFKWLRDPKQNLGDIIKETVNAQTLSASVREMMKSAKEPPEKLFNLHFQSNTSFTSAAKSTKPAKAVADA